MTRTSKRLIQVHTRLTPRGHALDYAHPPRQSAEHRLDSPGTLIVVIGEIAHLRFRVAQVALHFPLFLAQQLTTGYEVQVLLAVLQRRIFKRQERGRSTNR